MGWEGRGVGGVLTWERLASSLGGVAPAWGRALSSPAWLLVCEGVGRVLGWEGNGVIAWERLASSTGEVGREGGGLRWEVLAWERLASSPGGVAPAWGRVLSSPAWLLVCEGGDLPGRTCCLPQGAPGGLGLTLPYI